MNSCQHDWVYEPAILCSLPPKQRKICKKCKKEVIETLGGYQDYNEYYRIKKQKARCDNEH